MAAGRDAFGSALRRASPANGSFRYLDGWSMSIRRSSSTYGRHMRWPTWPTKAWTSRFEPAHRMVFQPFFSQRLLSSPWCVYATPAYLAHRGTPLSPDDLTRHRLIGFRTDRGGSAAPWRFRSPALEKDGGLLGIDVDAPIVFDDGCAAYDMAAAGQGLVWAPEWLASGDLKLGRVIEVLADWRSDEQIVSIVRRDRRLTPRRIRVVLDALKAAADLWQDRGS